MGLGLFLFVLILANTFVFDLKDWLDDRILHFKYLVERYRLVELVDLGVGLLIEIHRVFIFMKDICDPIDSLIYLAGFHDVSEAEYIFFYLPPCSAVCAEACGLTLGALSSSACSL